MHFHTLCMQAAKALTRLRICAVSSEPLLPADALRTKNLMCLLTKIYIDTPKILESC